MGEEVVSQDSSGLHHFLLAALLSPHSLGIPPSEDETARKFAAEARVSTLISYKIFPPYLNPASNN